MVMEMSEPCMPTIGHGTPLYFIVSLSGEKLSTVTVNGTLYAAESLLIVINLGGSPFDCFSQDVEQLKTKTSNRK